MLNVAQLVVTYACPGKLSYGQPADGTHRHRHVLECSFALPMPASDTCTTRHTPQAYSTSEEDEGTMAERRTARTAQREAARPTARPAAAGAGATSGDDDEEEEEDYALVDTDPEAPLGKAAAARVQAMVKSPGGPAKVAAEPIPRPRKRHPVDTTDSEDEAATSREAAAAATKAPAFQKQAAAAAASGVLPAARKGAPGSVASSDGRSGAGASVGQTSKSAQAARAPAPAPIKVGASAVGAPAPPVPRAWGGRAAGAPVHDDDSDF